MNRVKPQPPDTNFSSDFELQATKGQAERQIFTACFLLPVIMSVAQVCRM